MRSATRFFVLSWCVLFLLASGSSAVDVSGTITTQTWYQASSPYRVTGTITVPAGNTLTIEPGVDVLFDADGRSTPASDASPSALAAHRRSCRRSLYSGQREV